MVRAADVDTAAPADTAAEVDARTLRFGDARDTERSEESTEDQR
jgi:hypothetical protein